MQATIKELQEYFKNNFYDNKGRIKGLKKTSLYKSHKEFLDKLFQIEPNLNQDNLRLIHIEYFLFKNYSYEDLKCPFCNKLKDVKHGKQRNPFKTTCKDHKEQSKEIVKKIQSESSKKYMSNEENKKRIFEKMKKTIKERYNVDHHMKNEKIKNKMIQTQKEKYGDVAVKAKSDLVKQTWIKKYGVDNPLKNKEIKEKMLNTQKEKYGDLFFRAKREQIINSWIEKYGTDNPMKSKQVVDKAINMQKEKYGDFVLVAKRDQILKTWEKNYKTTYPMQNEKIKEKMINTHKEKYGDIALKAKSELIKQNWIDKYGVNNPMKVKEIKEKMILAQKLIRPIIEQNNLKKYGVKYPIQKHLKNLDKLNKEYIEKNFFNENNEFLINKFRDFYGYAESRPYQILKELNIDYKHRAGTSQYEDEIVEFIKSLNPSLTIIKNSRNIISPKELDIYIPEKNFAIEFDGLYWHSTDDINEIPLIKNYHLEKTEACESKGINLLHIFENEWIDPIKQDIWKSIISYKLGIVKQRYFARKLQIKEVDPNLAKDFLEINHIQGNTYAKINIGLFENDKLVSLMTFSKPRYNKNYEYELIRFASLKYSACIGCASRLFKYFIKKYNPSSIISYANRRWAFAKSNLYKKIGFEFIQKSDPNYYYFKIDDLKLYHRSNFQKHKLKNYPDTKAQFDPSKTEAEIMFDSGYRRIYDCGQLVYEWKKN
jgi:hypothetical protein